MQSHETDNSKWIGLAIALSVIGFVGVMTSVSTPPKSPALARKLPSFDKSLDTQAKRKSAIDEMIKLGVLQKVDMSDASPPAPRAWVRSRFYGLNFDQKKDLMNVVYGYYCEDNSSVVLIRDVSTGKNVGTFSLLLGLEMN